MDNQIKEIDISIITNPVESTLDSSRNFGIFLNKSLSIIKMTHWYTENYNTHKILGKVYEDLSELFDDLQEEIIGTIKQQQKQFPQISYTLDFENINNYRAFDDINMKSYYTATQTIFAVLNSQEFTAYINSVTSGINNIKEEIFSTLNKANYLLDMVTD